MMTSSWPQQTLYHPQHKGSPDRHWHMIPTLMSYITSWHMLIRIIFPTSLFLSLSLSLLSSALLVSYCPPTLTRYIQFTFCLVQTLCLLLALVLDGIMPAFHTLSTLPGPHAGVNPISCTCFWCFRCGKLWSKHLPSGQDPCSLQFVPSYLLPNLESNANKWQYVWIVYEIWKSGSWAIAQV